MINVQSASATSPATAASRRTRMHLVAASRRRSAELQRRLLIARTLRAA